MDCSLPGFSIHGIFQARILERVAISLEMGQRGSCCDLCQSILFSSLSFIVSDLIFSSLIHFDLIFVYGVRRASQVELVVENTAANAGDIGDMGLIPGWERSLGGGHSNPLQYSCLENPTDRRAWWAIVLEVAKSWTQLKRLSMYTHNNDFILFLHLFCLFVYAPL